MIDGGLGNISADVFISEVMYQMNANSGKNTFPNTITVLIFFTLTQ